MKLSICLTLIVGIGFSCGGDLTRSNAHAGNLVAFATGLSHPVCITNSGDCRLFVVNQAGYIHILDSLGVLNPQPFLDIHERVTYGGERGLLGLAFHPQYSTNGYFYVNYVGAGDSTHISRFTVSAVNPDLADSLSEFKLMTVYQPYSNHNGGDLKFGPDGYLYIGLGDGGSGGDPGNRSQNPMELLGKMLRIDVNQGNPYAIPTTNPFYNNPAALGEIWALGLRNPWRFSFDRLTGDLWIADVGQVQVEEVDFQPAASTGGENYGWRCYEGNQVYNGAGCAPASAFTFPVYTYPHGDECSITGGFVYRGSTTSYYNGHYFFADYCSDRIWTLHQSAGTWVKEDFGRFQGNNFSTFGEDAAGQLYVAGISSGTIWRLDLNVPLNAAVSGTVTNGQAQCYNAINTISAGGLSSAFTVDAGGSSTMIAGHNIILNPNTSIMSGGNMHGYITPENQFCGGALSLAVLCDYSTNTTPVAGVPSLRLKVYPNPTKGIFVIDHGEDAPRGTVKVEVFGILGNRVLSSEYPGDRIHEMSLKDNIPGIYFVRIFAQGAFETVKMVLAR